MTNPSPQPPRVAQIGFFIDPAGRGPEALLESWPTLVDVAEAASGAGARVSLVQACTHTARLERNGVRYYFLPFAEPGLPDLASLGALLHTLAPEVLHVHGLGFPREVLSLTALLPHVPIILQDHASHVPRIWRRPAMRRALAVAAGIAFCAAEQARPFAQVGLVAAHTRLYEIPESTSRFEPGDQAEARRATGVAGDPALLWVGHLDANKDPLTVLEGVSAAVRVLPGLQLWCCFGSAPLLQRVQERVAADARLRDRVHLLGRVPHERVEQLLRAADIFVLGSHREGSGYALIEALACGLLPVVTDIPSFRALTAAGTVGRLWGCGDSHALCQALQAAAEKPVVSRTAVRAHFDRELSSSSVGAKLVAMYRDVLDRTRGGSGARLPAERLAF